MQSENETAQEQTDHLQSLLDDEKRLKDEANHDVLKTREVRVATYHQLSRNRTHHFLAV